MGTSISTLRQAISTHRRLWLTLLLAFPPLIYLSQLLLLCLRFHAVPNYVTWYDWPRNVWRIIENTPSLRDIVSIAGDEWLLEVGHMNYDYGHGIADWSLSLLPPNMLFVFVTGLLLATDAALLRYLRTRCGPRPLYAGGAFAVSGTGLSALTSVTVTWVACCGVPSWITGLTIVGLGFNTAFAIKPYGSDIMAAGTTLLLLSGALLLKSARPAVAVAGGSGMGEVVGGVREVM